MNEAGEQAIKILNGLIARIEKDEIIMDQDSVDYHWAGSILTYPGNRTIL